MTNKDQEKIDIEKGASGRGSSYEKSESSKDRVAIPVVLEEEVDEKLVVWIQNPLDPYDPRFRLVRRDTRVTCEEVINLGTMIDLLNNADATIFRKLHSHVDEIEEPLIDLRTGLKLQSIRSGFPESIYPDLYEVQVQIMELDAQWSKSVSHMNAPR